MDKGNDFIFRAIITENGSGFNSYCLDIDVSSHGTTVEEAKLNLLKQFENRFLCSAIPIENELKNVIAAPLSEKLIIDEFYFEHKLSSFTGTEFKPEKAKPEFAGHKEYDSKFIFIKQ